MLDTSLIGSFGYGLVGSLHCALMCGPVAILFARKSAGATQPRRWAIPATYHASRAAAYVLLGALLGGLGAGLHRVLGLHVGRALPWLLALALLLMAFDVVRRIPVPAPLQRLVERGWARAQALTPAPRAAAVGALTALLPCGLLYGIAPAAASTGTPWGGARLMAAFAIGTAPGLLAVQLPARMLTEHLGPRGLAWAQRLGALAAALALVARALMDRSGQASCCHH